MGGLSTFHRGAKELPWNKVENASTWQQKYGTGSCLSLLMTDSHLDMIKHLGSSIASWYFLCFFESYETMGNAWVLLDCDFQLIQLCDNEMLI